VTVCGGAESSCFLRVLGDQQVNELSLWAVMISGSDILQVWGLGAIEELATGPMAARMSLALENCKAIAPADSEAPRCSATTVRSTSCRSISGRAWSPTSHVAWSRSRRCASRRSRFRARTLGQIVAPMQPTMMPIETTGEISIQRAVASFMALNPRTAASP